MLIHITKTKQQSNSTASKFKTREQHEFGTVIYNDYDYGRISVLSDSPWSQASHSITEFYVDSEFRNQGHGEALLREAMRLYKSDFGGQASSKESVKLMFRNGFRMFNKSDCTLGDALTKMNKDSSVFMILKQKHVNSTMAQK